MRVIRLIQCASVAIALGLSTTSSVATALPDGESYIIYFYDAAHTQYAGERIFTCGRGYSAHGVITSHPMVILDNSCGGSGTSSGICAAWDQFHGYFSGTPIHKEPCPFID